MFADKASGEAGSGRARPGTTRTMGIRTPVGSRGSRSHTPGTEPVPGRATAGNRSTSCRVGRRAERPDPSRKTRSGSSDRRAPKTTGDPRTIAWERHDQFPVHKELVCAGPEPNPDLLSRSERGPKSARRAPRPYSPVEVRSREIDHASRQRALKLARTNSPAVKAMRTPQSSAAVAQVMGMRPMALWTRPAA